MKKNIISNNGNINGPNSAKYGKNNIESIKNAIEYGFDVKVDVWMSNNNICCGNYNNLIPIDKYYLIHNKIWFNCMDILSFHYLKEIKGSRAFLNMKDSLSFNNKFWTTNKNLTKNSIALLPELQFGWDLTFCYGICTDYPEFYSIINDD